MMPPAQAAERPELSVFRLRYHPIGSTVVAVAAIGEHPAAHVVGAHANPTMHHPAAPPISRAHQRASCMTAQ